MSIHENPHKSETQWEGLGGLRRTGIGVVSGGNFEGADQWVSALNLSPRKPGESWLDWSSRCAAEREAAAIRAKVVAEFPAATLEQLSETMRAAREEGDTDMIRDIMTECRARDGLDDTDPVWAHLIQDCISAIDIVEGEPE